jgi:hypothetical protein
MDRTDTVIHLPSLEEYIALMYVLEALGFTWNSRSLPTYPRFKSHYEVYGKDFCISLTDNLISYSGIEYYKKLRNCPIISLNKYLSRLFSASRMKNYNCDVIGAVEKSILVGGLPQKIENS